MAAGRRGGYSGNDSRDRVSEFDVSRREYVYSKDEYDYEWIRNTNHENNGRGRVRYARERIGVRQKDVKEREVIINGGYRSSSSRSGSGSSSGGGSGSHGLRRPELSLKAVDREPGELSSESGSDDAAEIESVSKLKDNEVSKVVENGTRSPLERKRDFSRIVWDGDDNDVGKSRKSPVVTALPPPPPLPMAYQKSPNVVPKGGVHISPIKSRGEHRFRVDLEPDRKFRFGIGTSCNRSGSGSKYMEPVLTGLVPVPEHLELDHRTGTGTEFDTRIDTRMLTRIRYLII